MAALTNESKIPVGALLVGKYRVTREIGRGGMAAVYEAEHMALGKKIAVKVLAAELAASTVVIERFFREARAAASVRSPHIVDVYDSGRLEDGRPFIAMEMLEGESLYERMARIRIIAVRSTVQIIRHCCKGLTKAHAAGIIHRDLKPENIFLVTGEEGEEIAKILDFGLAKFYAPVSPDEKASRLTREGAVFGTPAYMSPEQVKGQGSVDHRADLWALGCMTYECLIGRPVWNTDQGVAMTFAAIATGVMPVPSQMRPGLPASFDEWFRRALDRDPDKRFQTANELGDALLRAFNQQPLASTSDSELRAIAQLAELVPEGDVRMDTNPLLLQDAPPSQRHLLVPSYVENSTGRMQLGSISQQVLQPTVLSAPRPSPVRYAISGAFMLVGTVAAFTVWHRALGPQILEPTIASTASGATAPPEPGDAGGTASGSEGDPRWAAALEEGERFFATGDPDTALRKFKEAQDQGATSGRWFIDQVRLGPAGEFKGPCHPIAFSQPRLGVPGAAERPTITSTARGALVAWTDAHEQAGHDHVYSTVIDSYGRPTSRPRDLTPEGTAVERPSVLSAGDRTVLLYLDKAGREAGVRVRWLDGDGRIGAASMLVGGKPGKSSWPAIDRAPDGYYVAWQDDRDGAGDDLFLRKLSPGLEVVSPEIRATDYAPSKGKASNVRVPSLAVASNALYVVYKLERPGSHEIERMRIPLSSPELATGLDDRPANAAKKDRTLGDVKTVDEDKVQSDGPVVACGKEGCFVAWHGEQNGGAFAALLEPVKGNVVWHKKFAAGGSHPTLGVNGDGQVYVAFYEGNRLKVAQLTRDGIGPSSVIAKVGNDQPRPWLAGGAAKGEWWLTWTDTDSGHTEPFAARVACTTP
jgi:serine/threonine protein kinase